MSVENVIALAAGIALFLFGMTLMGDGLKNVAGNRVEMMLYKLAGTPLKGVLLGTGVTAVIQSSSATSVMVVGFVNSGMMRVKQAIGIILGAILGTSITGWIVCLSALEGSGWVSMLSTSNLAGVVAIIGIILRMFSKKPARRRVGDICLGFAVLMFGMQAMSGAVAPLRESAGFIDALTTFSNPFIGIMVGLVFTAVIQSASAAVGILQALALTGAVTFSVAFPMLIGIAIGAAVPVLLSALGANTDGKRTAFTYLLIDVIGGVIIGGVFYILNAVIGFDVMGTVMTTVTIALLNTVYRGIIVAIESPMIGAIEKLIERIIPDSEADKSLGTKEIDSLEERFIPHPTLAIEQSRIAINSMATRTQENLMDAFALFGDYSEAGMDKVARLESLIDKYEDKLGTYLMKITEHEMTKRQSADVAKYLHTINDFERISDHALNLSETAQEIFEKKVVFSQQAQKEIGIIVGAVTEIVDIAFRAFIEDDTDTAYRVEPLEELIDNLCDEAKLHHVERLRNGLCTLNQGFVFNDLLTNCERVADHCSNIAVAVIELDLDSSFDTHEFLDSLKEMHTNNFDKYFEEYRAKYSFEAEE